MHAGIYPEVPDDFGNWLAGFIDGEGSFNIVRVRRQGYACRFAIALRSDDHAVLDEIQAATGVGRVLTGAARRRSPNSVGRSTGEWIVIRKHDCQRLVEILDRFPLRAKKARDFAIWREAVLLHATMRASGGPSQAGSVLEHPRSPGVFGIRARAGGRRSYIGLGRVTRAQAEEQLAKLTEKLRREGQRNDWTEMAALRDRLISVRAYIPHESDG